jgi:EAL domain-containing protein (putative c-di-GMP-specific phosphodiesterase class I)/GGDEF domain-containing protein
MDREQLRVAYQPIVELTDQRLVAVEALVRLPGGAGSPRPDLAGPAQVVKVAEGAGLIAALGTEVLAHACSQLASWRIRPHLADLQVHVNVSALQLRDDRFAPLVERTLAITGLPPDALVLEVTETAAFEEDGAAEATLATLSAFGVEISIDDFGTGFASLDRLASTPARSLKLDRSFVASVGDLGEVPRGRALVVQAAIGLGNALGLRVVAEGIETPAQARTLAAWGCLYGQGYLFARPALARDLDLADPTLVADRGRVLWDRSPVLSSAAIDLALAVATVVSAANPDPGTVRADAQELALQLAAVCGLDRRQADTSAILATIADAPQRFADIINSRTGVAAAAELARVLASRSDLGPGAGPGGIAASARRLAVARRDGASLPHALGSITSDHEPVVVARLDAWWHDTAVSPSPFKELPSIERRLRNRDDASRRLRSLSALTHAIGGSGTLEDVLEVTAEEALTALGAASLSVVRLERELGTVGVLVNVGDLSSGRQRRPDDEAYPLTDFPRTVARLLDRSIQIEVARSGSGATEEARRLARSGTGSSAAVPIVVDNVTWGAVYATTAAGAPPFTPADTPFLTAIAGVVSLAIRRFDHVDELGRLADEDPLTRIANRRALEDRLTRSLSIGGEHTEVGLLMLDVVDLNELNAALGQAEGDRVLVRVADVISRVALTQVGAFAARLGGDEFCIALDVTRLSDEGGRDTDEGGRDTSPAGPCAAESLLTAIRSRLADGPSPRPTLSAGYASVRPGAGAVGELLRRADAAQYLAKCRGVPLVSVGPDRDIPTLTRPLVLHAQEDSGAIAPRPGPERASTAALRRWGAALEHCGLLALEGLGEAVSTLLDLNRWVISVVEPDDGRLLTERVNIRRRRPKGSDFPSDVDDVFLVTDYPATAAALHDDVGFSVHVDDPAADSRERALLRDYGLHYLVAIPAWDGKRRLLLELFGDGQSNLLDEARPVIEALASRTLLRAISCPPARTANP